MRRVLSISFIVAAFAVILSLSVVPHHHHDSEPCATEHHEDSGSCVAESDYTYKLEREQVAPSALPPDDIRLPMTVELVCGPVVQRRDIPYKHVDIPYGGGLRAPPAIFC